MWRVQLSDAQDVDHLKTTTIKGWHLHLTRPHVMYGCQRCGSSDVLTLSRICTTWSFEFSWAVHINDITFVIGASSGKLCSLAKLCLRADWAPLKEKSNKFNRLNSEKVRIGWNTRTRKRINRRCTWVKKKLQNIIYDIKRACARHAWTVCRRFFDARFRIYFLSIRSLCDDDRTIETVLIYW